MASYVSILQNMVNSHSVRYGDILVTGHAIDQFLIRSRLPRQGGRDFEKLIGRSIVKAIMSGVFKQAKGECRLLVFESMGYVVRVFPHYRKVLTCYQVRI